MRKKYKWMTVSILYSLRRELTDLLTWARRCLVSGTENDTVVSWIILWWRIKVYWLNLTLAYILYHAVCCASATNSSRSLYLIISQLRTKYSLSNCPNNARRTKSSIKKRIIVRGTQCPKYVRRTNTSPMLRTGFRQEEVFAGLPGIRRMVSHSSFTVVEVWGSVTWQHSRLLFQPTYSSASSTVSAIVLLHVSS